MSKEQSTDLWTLVGNKCLESAMALLNEPTASTAATAEAVKNLVDAAVAIDMLNLHWAHQNRFGAAVFRDQPFGRPPRGNSAETCAE